MRRTSLTVATVAAGALLALAPRVDLSAYVTTGHAWGGSTVAYYVNPDNLYMSANDAIAGVQTAANAWNTQAGVNLQLVYAGTTSRSSLSLDYTNNVFFRNDSSGYIAETYWWWDGTGKLVDADIVYHENYRFYADSASCNGDGYYISSVGVHELGHALGLNHSSVDSATMWPSSNACDTSFLTLDADDIAGVRSLYPAAPTTPPGTPDNPSPTTGSTNVSTSVTLSWDASSAQSYDVYVNGQLKASGLTKPSYSMSGLSYSTSSAWYVVARNSVGTAIGPMWSFTTQAEPATTTTTTTSTPAKGKGNGGKKNR
jgi:hypothetical protein